MKKNNKLPYLVLFIVVFVLGLSTYLILKSPNANAGESNKKLEVTGKVTNQQDADEAFELVKKNIKAVNDKNMDAYLDTLVPEGRKDTKKEIASFFKDYDIQQTLISFEVIKQEKDSMLVALEQKNVNKGNKEYRNHIAQIHDTIVKTNEGWKIKEAVVTNTNFTN